MQIDSNEDYKVELERLKGIQQILDNIQYANGIALANLMMGKITADDYGQMRSLVDTQINFWNIKDEIEAAMRLYERSVGWSPLIPRNEAYADLDQRSGVETRAQQAGRQAAEASDLWRS